MTTKTIASASARLLRQLYDRGAMEFTLQDIYHLFPDTPQATIRKLASDMVKRGLLFRIKGGAYGIIPYDQNEETYFPNPHTVIPSLVGNADYYVGYYSALDLYSLITQPSLNEQVVVNRQVTPSRVKIRGYKFQFIYHNSDHFFGATVKWINNYQKVRCSDLEKTWVDCLYKPHYGGGITEIAKALFKAKEQTDFDKLLAYCKRFKVQSVLKRLGFLLELLNINTTITTELKQLITPSLTTLDPSLEKKGTVIAKWSLLQNLDSNDITSPIFT